MSPAEKKQRMARQTVRQPVRPAMKNATEQAPSIIVKTFETKVMGSYAFEASRCGIGYVLSGHKRIYTGDLHQEVAPGDIFFLNKGLYYFEDVPELRKHFEQIMFFYTPEQISSIITSFSVQYNIDTGVRHLCEKCDTKKFLIEPGWNALKHFFAATNKHLRDGYYSQNPTAETLALTELIFNIISQPEGCLRTRVLNSSNPEKELMERQLEEYIFSDITIEEFALRTNRSLSSFKKMFRLYFKESPHRWVLRRRLMHARQQVISTDKSIEHIARDCCFPSTSHFIQVFQREFGLTPTQYRRKYSMG